MRRPTPSRLPDSVFELVQHRSTGSWVLGLVVALAILALGAAWSWRQQGLLALDAVEWELRKAKPQPVAKQTDSPQPQRDAVVASRARVAAVLADLERCHPPSARVRSLNLDAHTAVARVEIEVDGDIEVHPWADCLNTGQSAAGRWILQRVSRADSGMGQAALWIWSPGP